MIRLKRVYLPQESDDGYRVLVDSLWPRGLKKDSAKIDLWFREVAPSSQLRKWFKHDPKKWREFQERYSKELNTKSELLAELRWLGRKYKTVTLLFAAKDETFNQAVALKQMLS